MHQGAAKLKHLNTDRFATYDGQKRLILTQREDHATLFHIQPVATGETPPTYLTRDQVVTITCSEGGVRCSGSLQAVLTSSSASTSGDSGSESTPLILGVQDDFTGVLSGVHYCNRARAMLDVFVDSCLDVTAFFRRNTGTSTSGAAGTIFLDSPELKHFKIEMQQCGVLISKLSAFMCNADDFDAAKATVKFVA